MTYDYPIKFFHFITILITLVLFLTIAVVPAGYAEERKSDGIDEQYDDFEDTEESLSDFEDTGESLSDFEEKTEESEPVVTQENKCITLPFDVNGSVSVATSFNYAHSSPKKNETDWRGFSKLKPEFNLEVSKTISNRFRYFLSGMASYDLNYGIRGRNEFTDEVIDEYEAEAEIAQAYVQVELFNSLDLKAGRQIVVWGKSDTIRVVDILNPLSIQEPGLTDIEDLRIPLFMTRLDYYLNQWSFSSIFIHEIRFDKLPVWGSDFYPASSPLPYEIKPESSVDNTEYAFSVGRTFNGGDIAFYYADVFNDTFHIETVSEGVSPMYDPHLEHSRIVMIGSDVNLTFGNWLLKSEVALIQDIAYYNPADNDGSQIIKGNSHLYDRYDVLIGFEYMGIDDTVVSLDTVVRYIRDYDTLLETSPLGPDKNEKQWAFRTSRTFLNETLTVELLASIYEWDGDGGAYERLTIEYDVSDAIKTRGGCIIFQSGNQTGFESIGSNDRLFFNVEYSF
jgi:hypothetical protein